MAVTIPLPTLPDSLAYLCFVLMVYRLLLTRWELKHPTAEPIPASNQSPLISFFVGLKFTFWVCIDGCLPIISIRPCAPITVRNVKRSYTSCGRLGPQEHLVWMHVERSDSKPGVRSMEVNNKCQLLRSVWSLSSQHPWYKLRSVSWNYYWAPSDQGVSLTPCLGPLLLSVRLLLLTSWVRFIHWG